MKIKTAFVGVLVLCLFAGCFTFFMMNESENQKTDLIKIVARDLTINPSQVTEETILGVTGGCQASCRMS